MYLRALLGAARRLRRAPAGIMLAGLLTACAVLGIGETNAPTPFSSTYEGVLDRARSGEAESQNLVGWMLFNGESAPLDREAAHDWFLRAAGQGHASAVLNLAVMHFLGTGADRDWTTAEAYFRRALINQESVTKDNRYRGLELTTLLGWIDTVCEQSPEPPGGGQTAFETFCSGCHGANGIAEFRDSPSFALGERMEKGHGTLLQIVRSGHGQMPAWGDKLPEELLSAALDYARSLEDRFRLGTLHVLHTPPDRRFSFGPMSGDFGRAPTDPSLRYGGTAPPLEDYCSVR